MAASASGGNREHSIIHVETHDPVPLARDRHGGAACAAADLQHIERLVAGVGEEEANILLQHRLIGVLGVVELGDGAILGHAQRVVSIESIAQDPLRSSPPA